MGQINLTTDGVVFYDIDGHVGWMHPLSFKDMFGEEAYQELLARPRVPSPYPELEVDECLLDRKKHHGI